MGEEEDKKEKKVIRFSKNGNESDDVREKLREVLSEEDEEIKGIQSTEKTTVHVKDSIVSMAVKSRGWSKLTWVNGFPERWWVLVGTLIVGLILGLAISQVISLQKANDFQNALERKVSEFRVSSSNSEVFHRPDCSLAKKILWGNIVEYQTREDALKAGKKPCKICNP